MTDPLSAISIATREYARLVDCTMYTHHDRVSEYAHAIAVSVSSDYNLSELETELIKAYAAFHDIGKLALPKDLLYKPRKLTDLEMVVVRTHSAEGLVVVERILNQVGEDHFMRPDMLRRMVGDHHERLDGSGYPRHLRGEEIFPEVRIVMVADAYDAITSHRPYQKQKSIDYAFRELDAEVDQGRMCGKCVRGLKDYVNKQGLFREEP